MYDQTKTIILKPDGRLNGISQIKWLSFLDDVPEGSTESPLDETTTESMPEVGSIQQ